jgi:hypothetical protein
LVVHAFFGRHFAEAPLIFMGIKPAQNPHAIGICKYLN